jgi:hypothetical protein
MDNSKVNYRHLHSEYMDPTSESYKKLRIVDRFLKPGYSLLDYDISTVDLIELEKLIMRIRFKIFIIKTKNFPILNCDYLRKKFHLFSICCILAPAIRNG